ncbi:MAG TPA: DNA primase [Pyrinomonadaceae bacterium]
MLYPQYFIDDLKNRADIVRIIQPYAELKKKGSNWMACCPFHQEKTPSFSVNPSKGFYKCFGCGKGGSVYNFLMEMEGLNFPEAIKRVAEITGVMLPEPIDDEQYARTKKKKEEKKKIADEIIELNRLAMEFWESELGGKRAKAAREYLEKRGLSTETQKTFRIGFSPDTWDSLLTDLKEKGADEKLIEQSGLVAKNEERNSLYDRFRGRIMFPVLDVNGKPIAFGARAMGKDEPKYLNSPETPAYIKGQHLYGLFQSKTDIRNRPINLRYAILVEGYLDLLALYEFGIQNTAASLGTAFTTEQARLLSRFTKRVVVNYDGDEAGIKAARRAIEYLLPQDLEIKVLILPDGKDPDDFVRQFGTDAYNEVRGKALPYLQFCLDTSVRGRNLSNADQKSAAIEEVLPIVSAIRNPIKRQESFGQIVSYFRINDADYKKELAKIVRTDSSKAPATVHQQVLRVSQNKITIAEQRLLEHLIYDPELQSLVLPTLEASDYESLATASVFRALMELRSKGEEPTLANLGELTDEGEIADDFVPLLLMTEPKREPGEDIETVLNEAENCVVSLRLMAINNHISELLREQVLAEQGGDTETANQLARESIELAKMKREFQQRLANL